MTDLSAAYESLARAKGWTPKRDDGSLNAGVVRYTGDGRGGYAYQWVGSWEEACSLDNIGRAEAEAKAA